MMLAYGVPNHYLFTGKERDTESGNDYFGARNGKIGDRKL
jgi:hypothetical protein